METLNSERVIVVLLAILSILFTLFTIWDYNRISNLLNKCEMTYSWPVNTPLDIVSHKKYKLYSLHMQYARPLHGFPVLFIPGHLGSYKQARSIGRHGFDVDEEQFDFFSVDFNQELSALTGELLIEQSQFINKAISEILKLYARDSNVKIVPKSVIVFAHSMGGFIARSAFTLPDYVPGSIQTLFTFSSPHERPPFGFDASLQRLYDLTNAFWKFGYSEVNSTAPTYGLNVSSQVKVYEQFQNTVVISLSGGYKDLLIHSSLTKIRNVVPETNGFSSLSTNLPGVGIPIDHLCLLWCHQLLSVVAKSMSKIMNPKKNQPYESSSHRMDILKRTLFRDSNDRLQSDRGIDDGFIIKEFSSIGYDLPYYTTEVFRSYGSSVILWMFIILLLVFSSQLIIWQLSSLGKLDFPQIQDLLYPTKHARFYPKTSSIFCFGSSLVLFYQYYVFSRDSKGFSDRIFQYGIISMSQYMYALGILAVIIWATKHLARVTYYIRQRLRSYARLLEGWKGYVRVVVLTFCIAHVSSFQHKEFRKFGAVRELSIIFLALLMFHIIQLINLISFPPPTISQNHSNYRIISSMLHFFALPCWIGSAIYYFDNIVYDKDITLTFAFNTIFLLVKLCPSIVQVYFAEKWMIPIPPVEKYSLVDGFLEAMTLYSKTSFVPPENCPSCWYEEGGVNAVYEECEYKQSTVYRVVACTCIYDLKKEDDFCEFCRRQCIHCGGSELSKRNAARIRTCVMAAKEEGYIHALIPVLIQCSIVYLLMHPLTREYRIQNVCSFVSLILSIYHQKFGSNMDLGRNFSRREEPMMYEIPTLSKKYR